MVSAFSPAPQESTSSPTPRKFRTITADEDGSDAESESGPDEVLPDISMTEAEPAIVSTHSTPQRKSIISPAKSNKPDLSEEKESADEETSGITNAQVEEPTEPNETASSEEPEVLEAAEEEDEDGDEELYVVESIVTHRNTRRGKEYKVRWEGYGAADDTWEPHDSLMESASLKVEEYWAAQEELASKGSSKKRKRVSGISEVVESNLLYKKRRQDGSLSGITTDDAQLEPKHKNTGSAASEEEPSRPKSPGHGLDSWEEDAVVETLEQGDNHELMVLLEWPGTKRRSRHPAQIVYKKMPQSMLLFYERNLVFKTAKNGR